VLSHSYRTLFELGKAGQRMFWYLVEVVQRSPCSDEIYLYWRKVIEFNGDTRTRNGKGTSRISKAAFYDGIKQLQAAGFIARQDRPHFSGSIRVGCGMARASVSLKRYKPATSDTSRRTKNPRS